MDKYFPHWESQKIHESSPTSPALPRYAGSNYSYSHLFEDLPLGSFKDGVRNENLEHLTFDDETFDLFITQDVFEHLLNPDIAAREIVRVLKPGGAHVFTAPKHEGLTTSCPRVAVDNGETIHVKPAEYHGNPVGDGRSLVTWDYGDDFEFLLDRWCGFPTVTYVTRDVSLGLDGRYLEVFVTRKIAVPGASSV